MKVTDPIADLLTRIRNAASARKWTVHVPHSNLKQAVCGVLKENGYIVDARVSGEGIAKELVIDLNEQKSDIHIRSISKPGQRIYVKSQEIPRVLDGLGLAIVSTPKGVMSGEQARKQKVGGEYICEVY